MKYILFLIMAMATLCPAMEFDIDDFYPMGITTSQFTSGALFTSGPTYIVYEMDNSTGTISTTEIITSTALTANFDAKTGLHTGSFQLTTAAGFDAGNAYIVFFQATVDSVAAGFSKTFKIQPAIVAIASVQTIIAADVANIDGDAMRGTENANTTVPDVAGTAAGLHTTTDAKIDTTDTLITNRTLAAADYFLFGSDPVAVVTTLTGHTAQSGNSYGILTMNLTDPGTVPVVSPLPMDALNRMYRAWVFNKYTIENSVWKFYKADESTVLYERALTNIVDLTTINEAKAP